MSDNEEMQLALKLGRSRAEKLDRLTAAIVDYMSQPQVGQAYNGVLSAGILQVHFDTTERLVRAAARNSGGRICSAPGEHYALTSAASYEYVRRCVAKLRSQARDMMDRANEIASEFNRTQGGNGEGSIQVDG